MVWSVIRRSRFYESILGDIVVEVMDHALVFSGVLRGSVVKCLTRNPGVLGPSRTGSSGFSRGSVLGQDTSEPRPSTGETPGNT